MKREILLDGEMGIRFGSFWEIEAEYPADIFKCIACNYPQFRDYLVECHENNIGFTFSVADQEFTSEQQLLMNLSEGAIIITPVPAGSKSGGAKILAAIAIVALTVAAVTFAGPGGIKAGFAALEGISLIATQAAFGIAVNLALTGIQQLMAPDPETDDDQDPSYLFNGTEQNIIEGDPIPVCYGQLRIPGQPISASVTNRTRNGGFSTVLGGGSITGSSRGDYISFRFGAESPGTLPQQQ